MRKRKAVGRLKPRDKSSAAPKPVSSLEKKKKGKRAGKTDTANSLKPFPTDAVNFAGAASIAAIGIRSATIKTNLVFFCTK